MSERIRQLSLQAFRGVPDELLIDLGEGQSLVVFGENGTGKSTIADALEWYLTGEIELLAHEGRKHAVRHLGSESDRETAVEVVTGGELSGRSVFPDPANERAHELAARETFLLRGRTLADFINKTKTEKWKALSEILGLDGIDGLRQDLQRARTELRKRAKSAAEELAACQQALRPGGGELSDDGLLQDLGHICQGLGIEAPTSLDRLADPTWLAPLVGGGGAKSVESQRDEILAQLESPGPLEWDGSLLERHDELVGSERLPLFEMLGRAQSFTQRASGLETCPLCGQDVAPEQLEARITESLAGLASLAEEIEVVRAQVAEQIDDLSTAQERREGLRLRAGMLGLELAQVPAAPSAELRRQLDAQQAIQRSAVAPYLQELEAWDASARSVAKGASAAESTASEDQMAMLLQLCRHIQAWRDTEKRAAHTARARDLVDKLYAAYQERQQSYLTEILDRVNGRVAEIYESLHPGEGLSQVSVEPWTAKGIELAIEFHGSRQRPPHGVLSESHLNSLAIALFLAMAETFNERLGFLVLDDVINSFDLEHRGSLADLLTQKAEWQLIVLTHDHQFFEHLRRRAPSWKKLELTSWSYDEGPRTNHYRSNSLLAEAQACLEEGDANSAATKTRRALEEQLQEVCEALQALLSFRRGVANDRRELGELFKGLRRALKAHAKPLLQELEPLLKSLEADVGAILNVEAHASRGRAAAGEVEAALERTAKLDATWSCDSCGTRIWHKGTPEAARCRCGKRHFPPAPAA